MSAAYPFLQALGLDAAADERAIRRAYAVRLKRIDQEADAAAFQALREAYERAMHWSAWRQAQEAPADAVSSDATHERTERPHAQAADAASDPASGLAASSTTALPAASVAAPPGPPARQALPPAEQTAADAVFARFLDRARQVFVDEAGAKQALDEALQDDRLLNLEARTLFEWRVACLLVQGWRPGHEFLFTPACRIFEWDTDRRRLALFGSVGATLDAAIQQRMIFYRQSKLEFDTQRAVIRRLRSEEAPSPGELGSMSQRLRLLVQRYPHWLPIITSAANVRRWGELWQQSAAQPAPSKDIPIPEALRPAAPPRSHQGWVWGGVAGFVLVLRGLAGAIGGAGEPPRIVHNPPSASTDWPARPPATSWPDLSRPTLDPLDGGTMTVPSSEIAPSPLAPPRGHADLLLHGPSRQAKPAPRDRAKSLQQRQQDMEQALREAGLTPAAPASAGTPSGIAPGGGLRGGDLLPTPGASPLGDPWKKP